MSTKGIVLLSGPILISPVCVANSSDGLLKFDFVLTPMGRNSNRQIFLADECQLPEVYTSPIGEPFDQDHDQGFKDIVGEITGSKFVQETFGMPAHIFCSGVIFEDLYPDVAMKARRGAGRWAAISMEAIPNPLERVGQDLIIHRPKFFGAGIVRLPGSNLAQITKIDGKPGRSYSEIKEDFQIPGLSNLNKQAANLKQTIQGGLRLIS